LTPAVGIGAETSKTASKLISSGIVGVPGIPAPPFVIAHSISLTLGRSVSVNSNNLFVAIVLPVT
jgi:hypothetical protein